MIQYMPASALIQHVINAGDLSNYEVKRLNEGRHDNYMSGGSMIMNPKRLRLLNGYRVMLRLMCFLPPWAKHLLINLKVCKIFWMAPFRLFISVLDIMIAIRDRDATTYVKNYWWWFRKRFDKNYYLYMFKKRKRFKIVSGGLFQLSKEGILGKKTAYGWEIEDSVHEH